MLLPGRSTFRTWLGRSCLLLVLGLVQLRLQLVHLLRTAAVWRPGISKTVVGDPVVPPLTNQTSYGDFVVFYNVYLPPDDANLLTNAKRIVTEQLGQVQGSYATRTGALPIFYNTIGLNTTERLLGDTLACPNGMRCTHLAHYAEAFEEVTLQKLYEHCRAHPNHTAIYLHNKGSLHESNGYNAIWRRHLTAAAVSQDCLTASAATNCNLCGTLYYPVWSSFIPGNMWSAQCEYIAQLLPPLKFGKRMRDVKKRATKLIDEGLVTTKLYAYSKYRPYFWGTDRYASEMWVGSHPDVRPCDLSETAAHDFWFKTERDPTRDFHFGEAPRLPLVNVSNVSNPVGWRFLDTEKLEVLMNGPKRRRREYFLLPGHVFRWMILYGRVPDESSFFWKFFPDGDFWRAAVAQYGVDAVEQVARQNL